MSFLDQREGAGWIHPEAEATDKTARLINASVAGRAVSPPDESIRRDAGSRVAVVGDPAPGDEDLFEYCSDCRVGLVATPIDPTPSGEEPDGG